MEGTELIDQAKYTNSELILVKKLEWGICFWNTDFVEAMISNCMSLNFIICAPWSFSKWGNQNKLFKMFLKDKTIFQSYSTGIFQVSKILELF